MQRRRGGPGGAHHPGLRPSREPCGRCADPARDAGAVVVEAAVATVALVAVALVLAWLLGLLGAQLAVGEAARAGARVAARGEPSSAVAAEARRLVPDAVVDLRPEGDHLVVDVRRPVALPGLLARWGPVVLQAGAVSLREPS